MPVTRAGLLKNAPAKVDAGIRKGLHTSGMKVAGRARRVIELFKPKGIATGATIRSITTGRVRKAGSFYHINIGPGTPQSDYLHSKTPPQRPPPLGRIIRWLQVKPGTRGMTVRQLFPIAKAVQMKIAREGTDALPFMTVALKMEKDEVVGTIYRAVIAELRKP